MSELTVCVPAYNAEAFIAETIDSIAAQTFSRIKVLISLDRGEDATETVCRRYLAEARFELIVQPERLGWVGNVNHLIGRVDTPFFCIIPHDDILDPRYLAEVHGLAKSDPAISCAYSDIQSFGDSTRRLCQPDLRGDLLDRVLDFLLDHFSAVAFRGVVRRHGPDDRPYLPTGLRRDFAVDTVWALQLALRGELRRVSAPLYAKRFDPRTVHAGWMKLPGGELNSLWAEHAATCVRTALAAISETSRRDLVLASGLLRVLRFGRVSPGFVGPAGPESAVAAIQAFTASLDCRDLPNRLEGILAQPEAWRLREGIKRGLGRERRPTLLERARWRVWEKSLIEDLRVRLSEVFA